MKFESKFNLGDEFYVVVLPLWWNDKWGVTNKMIVDTLEISNYTNKNGEIKIDISYFNDTDFSAFKEEDCFATLAEAQAECDRRNKEDK